jgi:hypothetical protein
MILYYALGGGLGHIARSFALIEHAPQALLRGIRLLVSSKSAGVARPHSPCSMDLVPDRAMADRALYAQFLADYLRRHNFSRLVTDTFPFGLLGELTHLAPEIPRVLVGRYLRWDAYLKRCGSFDGAAWPRVAIMIENQESPYLDAMERNSSIVAARWPVSLARPHEAPVLMKRGACCVVHSGTPDEMSRLINAAHKVTDELGLEGTPEVFTPETGVFPLERHLSRYSDVVTGAGYAACAAAAVLNGRIRYHLHPFPRRFDDQKLRLKRLRAGQWGDHSGGDASTVAGILWDMIRNL